MTCQELVELVTDALDDALEEPAHREFEAHMADCVDARSTSNRCG